MILLKAKEPRSVGYLGVNTTYEQAHWVTRKEARNFSIITATLLFDFAQRHGCKIVRVKKVRRSRAEVVKKARLEAFNQILDTIENDRSIYGIDDVDMLLRHAIRTEESK